ncbi:hypothetical protein A2U01_0106865, partial [Trifolium medium]|nr:hypothetical protein [Trifolium medium]
MGRRRLGMGRRSQHWNGLGAAICASCPGAGYEAQGTVH